MNYFQEKSALKIIKNIAKSVCIFAAAFTLAVFGGCDLFDFSTPDEKEDEVTISQSSAEISVGATITLIAVSSEKRAISWVSSDEEVATVDGGTVTGVGVGETTVTASDGKKLATCEITVTPAPVEQKPDPPKITVTISQTKAEIKTGATITLFAAVSDGSLVYWSSSDASVAKVDSNGKVTGVKSGTAVIKASDGRGTEAVCEVTVTEENGRKLVWSDEFNGNSLDTSKWGYMTGTQDRYGNSWGPQYWGNDELQYYTNGDNVNVSDGALTITAKRQNMGDREFTSARITTRDKFSQTYGYFEARIKSPAIEGLWPAFWMLPHPTDKTSTDNIYGGWPNNGELDIMEAKGRLKNEVDCTLHFGNTWQQHDYVGTSKKLKSNIDEWHTYAVDWRADYIAWIVDGEEVYRVQSSRWWTGSSSAKTAPFDKPFYILLNLAVGGQYDGYRVPPASFTQASMSVDYVRVYE